MPNEREARSIATEESWQETIFKQAPFGETLRSITGNFGKDAGWEN